MAWPSIFTSGIKDLITSSSESNLEGQGIISFIAITFGLDSLSRNVVILDELMGPSTKAFSIRKSNSRKRKTLGNERGNLWDSGPTAAGLVLYYFFKQELKVNRITGATTAGAFFMGLLSPGLAADVILDTGYHLSRAAEEKINSYHFRKMREEQPFSEAEGIRDSYLKQFADLKRIIYLGLDEYGIRDLYEWTFANNKPTFGWLLTRLKQMVYLEADIQEGLKRLIPFAF